jgi:integrase/recombinase XerD
VLNIEDRIAKKGGGRRIPMHPELRQALIRLYATSVGSRYVIVSRRGGRLRANSLVNWFVSLYATVGLEGCSSHSGRRTFITNAARNAHRASCSLRDVQLLAGHRSIETTQRYIDGDASAQQKLVRLL